MDLEILMSTIPLSLYLLKLDLPESKQCVFISLMRTFISLLVSLKCASKLIMDEARTTCFDH